jgi:flagellar hook-length control protein FliK
LKGIHRVTASASILATFAQPATRLATGDATGAAMGGFEALLAMLTQSLQGGEAASGGEATTPPSTDAPAADDDLAALLSQAGAATWLAQALSQTKPAEADTAPASGSAPQAVPAVPAPLIRTDLADDATETPPVTPSPATGIDTAALEDLLPGQTFEPANQSSLAWRKPMTDLSTAQLPGRPQAPVASAVAPAAAAAAPVVETAVAVQVLAAEAETAVQPSADAAAEVVAETVAAPAVIAPPVEAKTAAPPRKAATDNKVAKVEASDAKPAAASTDAAEIAEAETVADAAPAELAARDDEAPAAPVRTGETAVQTLAARLETVAANATALAAQVRGAPETVAKLAAGILDKLEGQSTKFDLQLDPHGLGKVDVSVEIGSDGKLTAQLGFDSQLGLSELRSRAQELRTALEQAGFTLADNALNFDFSGERRQQQAADSQGSNSDQAGKAFAQAMGALDDEPPAASTRYQARRGLDLLI